jgi:hypothetical protein
MTATDHRIMQPTIFATSRNVALTSSLVPSLRASREAGGTRIGSPCLLLIQTRDARPVALILHLKSNGPR